MKNRILIIDDDKDVCEVLKRNLTRYGYEASTVLSGLDGIEKLKRNRFDLIILDLKLPDLYGTEVLKEIRNFNKDIIVIILTGYPSIETAIDTLKNNRASDYIRKPFNINYLRIAIQKELENRKIKKELRLVGILEIGRKAKQLRLNKALSLDALARKSSLSKSFLSEFERGKKFPRLDTLQRLAKALEVDIHFFFNK